MGLDSVELLMAIEEEFGIEIPDEDAEQIYTVGQMYDFLRRTLHSTPPARCMTQRLFYMVRKAIIDNYGVPKRSITLDTKIADLVPSQVLKDTWPNLAVISELEFLNLHKQQWWDLGIGRDVETLTMRELVTTMTTLNAEKFQLEPGSDEEIWMRLTKVIAQQLNVGLHEIQPNASFARDLGAD